MKYPQRGIADLWKLNFDLPLSVAPGLRSALQQFGEQSVTDVALNEDFWAMVSQDYLQSPDVINLNYGGISSQPVAVRQAEYQLTEIINRAPSFYNWFRLEEQREHVRTALASEIHADPEEIAIVRNTTEGINFALYGLGLQTGDVIALTQGAYVNVKETIDALVKLRGVRVHWINEQIAPKDPGAVAAHYIDALPKDCKVLILMHLVNWTGQILPVADIAAAARERGIFVVADGAHAFAHFPVDMRTLNVDAWSASLMKWLNAPFGTGVMYLRKEHVEEVVPIFPQKAQPQDNIRKFEGQGTRAYAAELAILHAIEYHRAMGQQRKTARLRYLTRYWTQKAQEIPGFRLMTTLDGEWYGALGLFQLAGWQHEALVHELENRFRIHAVPIDWRGIRGVRISPTFYTPLAHLDLLVEALQAFAKAR